MPASRAKEPRANGPKPLLRDGWDGRHTAPWLAQCRWRARVGQCSYGLRTLARAAIASRASGGTTRAPTKASFGGTSGSRSNFAGKSIAAGDLLLYHAFVEGFEEGRLVGVARVSSNEPIMKPRGTGDHWPWWRSVTPLLIVPLAGHGPTLKDIGIDTPPMGGYKELQPAAFETAVRLLAANALPRSRAS